MSQRAESIRLSDWLASRDPAPPTELSDRLKEAVSDSSTTVDELPYALLRKGLEILSHVGEDRAAAVDLLTADALITYAMEAAAESGNVEDAALHAMREISSAE